MKKLFKKIVTFILTIEARVVLWKYRPRIVGVTGSVGKTSTKDAVFAVVQELGSAQKSQGSYNSELGVPLTILQLETAWNSLFGWISNIFKGLLMIILPHDYPEWLVLELGVDHPGDMTKVAKWLTLDTAIITHIGDTPVHVEFFSSPRAVLDEKQKIIRMLSKDGVLLLSHDDAIVREIKSISKYKTYTWGKDENADVSGNYYKVVYSGKKPIGCTFKITSSGNIVPVEILGVIGDQVMYPFLAAAAFGVSHGLNLVEVSKALSKVELPKGRMRLLDGKNESIIIDDSYNSSPIAVREALKMLKDNNAKRRIAILGDMMELGEYSQQAHIEMGELCRGLDVCVFVGRKVVDAAKEAEKAGVQTVKVFENAEIAGRFVGEMVKPGDFILVKGSQAVRLEKAAEQLLLMSNRAKELLVRQGKAWMKR